MFKNICQTELSSLLCSYLYLLFRCRMGFRGKWVNLAVIFPLLSMSSVYLQDRKKKNIWGARWKQTLTFVLSVMFFMAANCTWVVPLSFLFLQCLRGPEAGMGEMYVQLECLVLFQLAFLFLVIWPPLALCENIICFKKPPINNQTKALVKSDFDS